MTTMIQMELFKISYKTTVNNIIAQTSLHISHS